MSQTPKTPPTVGEIILALQQFDPELPVLVSTGYDNDTLHTSDFGVGTGYFHPEGDGNIWAWGTEDLSDAQDDQISAVVISG